MVTKQRQASLACWGKATYTPSTGYPIRFDLGGLGTIDLGEKLGMPTLTGLCLRLSRGGLRLLAVPPKMRIYTKENEAALAAGSLIPFGKTICLETHPAHLVGEICFTALEGVPEPLVSLQYLGGHPERRRRLLLLVEATDMGQATKDPTLERLWLSPSTEGVWVGHIPGHLRLVHGDKKLALGDFLPKACSCWNRAVRLV
ncbi:hypothetical protein [Meiothermus rufus]|uniref:hypothetical protein n=1 Tax=Meiothermus rufus TaxID=604332 RepID=UPI00040C8B41|nr:hypothetical protein [Meiothermus rufus]